MRKIWKRVLAGAMALTILGGVSQIPTAHASEIPPPSQTVPGEVRKDFGIPNSINVQVKDENGLPLRGGEFELLAEDGTVVARWNGFEDGIFSADKRYYVNEGGCQFKVSELYETGDYTGDISFYGGGSFDGRDGYVLLNYGETEKYISYGDKMKGEGAVIIPAGEVWINVDSGYKRQAGQEKWKQILEYNQEKYDLSDLAGGITKLHWPAGTSYGSFVHNGQTTVGMGENKLTAGSAAEEYQKITVDLHACYPEYVNEDGQYRWPEDGTVFTYGAPIQRGDDFFLAYLQITSGAVTNFVSLQNGPIAEIYVKTGDYQPRVSCSFDGNVHNGGGNVNQKLFVCSYIKHVFSVKAPPEEGKTIGFIPAGTYTLHQKTAIDGYIPAEDQQVVVTDSKSPTNMQMIELVNQKEKPHEHTYSEDWSTDNNYHWHGATCEHGDLVQDKAAHTYGDWTVTVQPTEDKEGVQERSCDVCGFKQQETLHKLPHEHTFSDAWSKDETNHWHAATCEHGNLMQDKAAHTYGDWTVTVQPTEDKEGMQERSCDVCGFKQQETLHKLPHEHTFSDAWSKDETNHWHAATCEHGDLVQDKAAHTYGDWTVTVQPTEDKEGVQERSCDVCGFKQQETLHKLPHEHTFSDAWSKDETNHWHGATCEHGDLVQDKAAHTYGDWTVTVQPTEDKEGMQERSCDVCGFTQQATMEKLPAEVPNSQTPPTGDNSQWMLWTAIALTAGVALLGTSFYWRKRRS